MTMRFPLLNFALPSTLDGKTFFILAAQRWALQRGISILARLYQLIEALNLFRIGLAPAAIGLDADVVQLYDLVLHHLICLRHYLLGRHAHREAEQPALAGRQRARMVCLSRFAKGSRRQSMT